MKKLISRRQFLVAMGAIAATGALNACGGGSSSTTTAASSSAAASSTAENVFLKLATWDNTSNTTVSDAVAAFEKANPNIKVEIIDIPSADYTTKLSVMLNGGSDVDAFYLKDSDTAKSLVDKGQLADLTGYIADAGIDLSVYNGLAENFAFDGKHTIMDYDTGYDFFQPYYEMAVRMQDEGTVQDYGTLKTGNIHYSGLFAQGTVGMLPMGSWFIATMIQKVKDGESSVNWGIATLPHPDGVEAGWTIGSTTPLSVNAASKKQDAAWKLVEFITGEEGASAYAKTGPFQSR